MNSIKKSFITVNSAVKCLALAPFIAMAFVSVDP